MSFFDAFGPLDDLIQVIYQASHRFVLLSRIEFDVVVPGWQVYLGLADVGRWWKGRWEEKDVDAFVGKNVSSELLEAFADNVTKSVMQGELFVSGMTGVSPGSDLKIVFDPNGTKPLSIPLTELLTQEAIIFVTNEFFELGLNAQKRKCRLNPPAFQTITSVPAPSHRPQRRHRESSPQSKESRKTSVSPPPSRPTVSKTPAKTERQRSPPRRPVKEKTPVSVPAKAKTKAPPVKRARKVQNMEFGSDDE
ncbi:hypothetical protein ACEPAF_7176 [Sanghuangporus sanghuang]